MRAEDRYDSLFQFYGGQSGVYWLLLKSQAQAESSFDSNAISPQGAMGLSQFMPTTWAWAIEMAWVSPGADAFNPERAVQAQAAYMDWLLKQFRGDTSRALAAYNWGIGNVKKLNTKRKAQDDKDWVERMPDETRNYLKRISEFYSRYRNEKDYMGRVA